MKRGILFSAPMILALLEGRKTQTRRIARIPRWCPPEKYVGAWKDNKPAVALYVDGRPTRRCVFPFRAGQRLWVRETWKAEPLDGTDGPGLPGSGVGIIYRADDSGINFDTPDWCSLRTLHTRWRPGIHMPRWASRITLEVEKVRLEPLQAITEEDARAEGFLSDAQVTADKADYRGLFAYDRFAFAWDEINRKRSILLDWEANPLIWALTFRRVS
jgi:hypothetical protein